MPTACSASSTAREARPRRGSSRRSRPPSSWSSRPRTRSSPWGRSSPCRGSGALAGRRVACRLADPRRQGLPRPLADILESLGSSGARVGSLLGRRPHSEFVLDPVTPSSLPRSLERSSRHRYGGARLAAEWESGARALSDDRIGGGAVTSAAAWRSGCGGVVRRCCSGAGPHGELVPNTSRARGPSSSPVRAPGAVEVTALGIAERLEGKIVVSVASLSFFRTADRRSSPLNSPSPRRRRRPCRRRSSSPASTR